MFSTKTDGWTSFQIDTIQNLWLKDEENIEDIF